MNKSKVKIDTAFTEYDLCLELEESLTLLGYKEPTPIQKEIIPLLLEGQDVVGKSQTGSGKTAAFAIPICEKVNWDERAPQALILEPTRELAVQVGEEIFQIGRKKKLKIPVIFGGMPIDKQVLSLKQKSHMVVGTPGRILDHLRRESLQLDHVKYLVIDEADLMLDMGFLEDVELIIRNINPKPIIALFSATLGNHLRKLVEFYMQEPRWITIQSDEETANQIEQIGYKLENDDKFNALMDILITENPKDCMLFCGTREMVNALYQQMKRKGIRCGMLHGAMEQRDRLFAIEDFRVGKFHYLITTDVAARGIDFVNMTHVINYDFPTNKENYVHRIGRTGRNGQSGKSISFIQESESRAVKAVEEYIGTKIEIQELPKREDVLKGKDVFFKRQRLREALKEKKGAVFNKSITKLSIGGGKKSKMRAGDIVGAVCSIDGVTQEDIGIVDVRDSISYVEIFNGKGEVVFEALGDRTIKGKVRKVRITRG